MLRALALLGAGAGGYATGLEDFQREQRAKDADTRLKVIQARQDKEYEQQQADDQAMRNAMAPVTVESGQVAVPIGSRDEPQEPSDHGITVNGKSYPDMASANTAAAAANTLPARMSRAAAVVQNPALAAKLGADSQTAQLTGLHLDEAQRNEANRVFDDGLRAALRRGPEALAQFMSDSAADGKGGAVKFQAQVNPDGSWQMMKLTPDGKQVPFGQKYTGDENGMAQAGFALSRAVSDKDKVAHVLALAKEARESDAQKSLDRYHTRMADYYDRLIDVKYDANDVRGGQNAGKLAKMPEEDKATLADLNKQLELINSERVKAQAAGMWQPDGPGAVAIAKTEAGLLMQRRALLAKYATEPAADPLNLRGGKSSGGEASATTRPPTKMEAIAADMKKTGATDASIQISNPDAPYQPTADPNGASGSPDAERRRRAAKVFDFSGKPLPGSAATNTRTPSDRVNEAKARIQKLQQEVKAAWGDVEAAKSKGPMFEARARDAWSAAKQRLQEAKNLAGA